MRLHLLKCAVKWSCGDGSSVPVTYRLLHQMYLVPVQYSAFALTHDVSLGCTGETYDSPNVDHNPLITHKGIGAQGKNPGELPICERFVTSGASSDLLCRACTTLGIVQSKISCSSCGELASFVSVSFFVLLAQHYAASLAGSSPHS